MNVVRVLDSITYAELAKIENVMNPLITEEINGVFNFEFETIYDEVSKFASGGNIIEIEDDYFRIATTTKNLNGTYRVFAEHVSFALTRAFFDDYSGDGIDGTAAEILTPVLNQIGWEIGSIDETPVKYYKPSPGTSVRKQILDIANLFELEVIWHKFSVSLVKLRGSLGPLEFKLGNNLLGVSETLDLTGEYPEYSYEVDVLDLSQLEGYEGFTKIELGDVVQLLAQNIELDGISRVVYRQYNPFEKVNVNLQIGHVAREFTNYERDEEEEEDPNDPKTQYRLETFTIDGVDMLSDDDITTSLGALLEIATIPKKVVITVKEQYQRYFIGVIVEQNGKGEKLFLDDDFTNGSLTINSPYTSAFLKGTVKVAVSDKPLNTTRADVQTFIADINLINNIENQLLEYFLIDTDDVLYSPGIDTIEGAEHVIYDPIQRIKLKLIDNAVFDSVNVGLYNGSERVETYDHSNFKEGILSVNTRSQGYADGLKIVVNIKRGEETIVYTVRCVKEVEEEPIEPFDSWLSEFRIGNVNCLDIPGIMIDGLNSELVELNYTKSDEYKGLFLQLHEKYRDAAIVVTDENGNQISYNDSLILPGERKKLLITLSLADEKQYYGLNFIRTDFKGLIIIKSYDEDGDLIASKEKKYTQTGIYEITAEEINGYYLMSENNVKVELTVYDNEKIVEFTYKNLNGEDDENGGGGISNSPYILEFGTAPITSNVNFAFNRDYTNIESVTLGVMSNTPAYMNMSWEPIKSIEGKYIGIRVIVSPVISGKNISVQAVCKR